MDGFTRLVQESFELEWDDIEFGNNAVQYLAGERSEEMVGWRRTIR